MSATTKHHLPVGKQVFNSFLVQHGIYSHLGYVSKDIKFCFQNPWRLYTDLDSYRLSVSELRGATDDDDD